MSAGPVVVKVSGSLFDLPDLGPRLRSWLESRAGMPVVLVPGGGPTADVIRNLDARHRLGEESAHWLALRALTLNAWFLTALLPAGAARVVAGLDECQEAWARSVLPVLDAWTFAATDEGRPGCLPHRWAVTSDSLAARVAVAWGASRLVLLKSVAVPEGTSWEQAGGAGLVDPFFPEAARQLADVRVINFRTGVGQP